MTTTVMVTPINPLRKLPLPEKNKRRKVKFRLVFNKTSRFCYRRFLLQTWAIRTLTGRSNQALDFVTCLHVKVQEASLIGKQTHTHKENKQIKHELPQILKSPLRPTRKMFVYKIQVNPFHTILKYRNYYEFMDREWCSSLKVPVNGN